MSPYPTPINLISRVPTTINLALYGGDGAAFKFTTVFSDGTVISLTDGVVESQIRANRTDSSAILDFEVDTADAADGVVIVSLTGEQTASLVTTGKFRGSWDLQYTPTNGEPMTVIQGTVTCDPDVTRP
jgi:hypothetical protein